MKPASAPLDRVRVLPRRRFLESLTLTAAGALSAPALLRGQNLNSRLNVAAIGVGGRGGSNLGEVARTENIVALCDVFEPSLDAAAKRHPRAWRETDFRKLYEREKEFDAVIVSTCEHTHALATLPALKLGRRSTRRRRIATSDGSIVRAGSWPNHVLLESVSNTGELGPSARPRPPLLQL